MTQSELASQQDQTTLIGRHKVTCIVYSAGLHQYFEWHSFTDDMEELNYITCQFKCL